MKRLLQLFLIISIVTVITGCGNDTKQDKNSTNNDTSNTNSQQQQETYTLVNFENDIKSLIPDVEKTQMVAEYINAESGFKLESGNSKLEVYKFDKNSSAYKTAEENQEITLDSFGTFKAIVKNGYALMIDDEFPNKPEIENLFNKLK